MKNKKKFAFWSLLVAFLFVGTVYAATTSYKNLPFEFHTSFTGSAREFNMANTDKLRMDINMTFGGTKYDSVKITAQVKSCTLWVICSYKDADSSTFVKNKDGYPNFNRRYFTIGKGGTKTVRLYFQQGTGGGYNQWTWGTINLLETND